MTPYVSKNPRSAFLNYRDVDIATNSFGKNSFQQGKVYEAIYFNANFPRLAKVKTAVDPQNLFRNEQSIPVAPDLVKSGHKCCNEEEVTTRWDPRSLSYEISILSYVVKKPHTQYTQGLGSIAICGHFLFYCNTLGHSSQGFDSHHLRQQHHGGCHHHRCSSSSLLPPLLSKLSTVMRKSEGERDGEERWRVVQRGRPRRRRGYENGPYGRRAYIQDVATKRKEMMDVSRITLSTKVQKHNLNSNCKICSDVATLKGLDVDVSQTCLKKIMNKRCDSNLFWCGQRQLEPGQCNLGLSSLVESEREVCLAMSNGTTECIQHGPRFNRCSRELGCTTTPTIARFKRSSKATSWSFLEQIAASHLAQIECGEPNVEE
ncbi:hypothetical protein VNO78_04502 [Psophocarpus tetragonolobus]|uniref:Berberine/berberine-like domain-containing protein n=1 Tax=Psophocarpus tetragonolobus TaxID=3891 RepID=A0AAN9TG60_PSOTE